jgi:hypothetical protein
MKVMAIDPGKTTGYCYGQIYQDVLEYYPFQRIDEVDDLWEKLTTFQPRFIIIEDFEFRKQSRAGLVLFSVELIGVTRLYSLIAQHQVTVFIQKAAEGKGYYRDETLKSKNLYKRGIPHAMDASRHLLQWYTFGYGYQFNNGQQDFAKLLAHWELRSGNRREDRQ